MHHQISRTPFPNRDDQQVKQQNARSQQKVDELDLELL
jgi:hypothetical protein